MILSFSISDSCIIAMPSIFLSLLWDQKHYFLLLLGHKFSFIPLYIVAFCIKTTFEHQNYRLNVLYLDCLGNMSKNSGKALFYRLFQFLWFLLSRLFYFYNKINTHGQHTSIDHLCSVLKSISNHHMCRLG